MSGPKISRYTLTPEQRKILEEQRKIERRKAVASENIKRKSKRLLEIAGMFNPGKNIAAELLARIGSDGGFSAKISELENLISPIPSMISHTDKDNVDYLENTSKDISTCLIKAKKLARILSAIAVKNEKALIFNLQSAIDEGFSTSFADIELYRSSPQEELRKALQLQLTQMKKRTELPNTYVTEVDEVLKRLDDITDENFLRNYAAVSITPQLKKCSQYLDDYEKYHEEFEILYTEYIAICSLHYYVAQECVCSLESINYLKEEIKRIKEDASSDDEQAYISDCLDEVMTEMGYSVLGSREVTKKNGRHFRNELYTYGEGTAVNVTYSSDGKIAMELGGIDTADRLPDERETSMLCKSMDTFCDDFKEIEKRLYAKGVVLADRISLLPSNREYAQIINTTEYEMETEAEKLQTKKQRKTTSDLKFMKKE